MEFDLDTFDDILPDAASKSARPGGKFQPKGKARPRKESAATPSTESVQTCTILDNNLPGRTQQEQFRNNEEHISMGVNGDWQSCFEKAEGDNADIFLGLETLDDFLPQSTTIEETRTVHISPDANSEKGFVDPDLSSTIDASEHSESPAQLDPLKGEEAAIFNGNGDIQNEDFTMGTKEVENFPCLEPGDIMFESIISSGPKIGKFKPKPNVHRKGKQTALVPNPDAMEPASRPEDIHSVPLQTEDVDEGSIPLFPTDDVLDFSSMRFSVSPTPEPTSAVDVNEEPENLTGTSLHSDAATIPGKHSVAVPVKRCSVRVQEHQKAPTSCQASRSSGRLRKQLNTSELVDEHEDDGLDNDYVLEDEGIDNNDDEYVVEDESLDGRAGSRSKKPAAEKEKPSKKRKKANEVSTESNKAPKKKFSHRTKRNKRRGNPDLLKIPEDEIDLQNLPLKDVIWLAEHRERMSNNEAKTSDAPTMNQRADSFSAYYDEDDTFASAQGGDFYDEQAASMVEDSSTYVNYRTHMKIKPRSRWSKQDTELFYEAVQQFGTDLSMIKECFPGRTREQIKSKYKKEEREHPLRLHDALTTRARDHSHFEVVIERLQQIAAEKQEKDRGDSINLTDEEAEEVAADMNEEEAKSEHFEEEVQDMEPDFPAVEGSMKSDDSEDDWSRYKSEI